MNDLAAQLRLPPENLVQPEALRRLAWTPPAAPTEQSVAARLRASGARPWQVHTVAARLAEVLPDPDPVAVDAGAADTPLAGDEGA